MTSGTCNNVCTGIGDHVVVPSPSIPKALLTRVRKTRNAKRQLVVTTEIYVLLSEWQFLSCRHRDLGFDDIYTGNHFGDGMFYLYPGIHLDEKKLSFFIEKLERASAAVTYLAACIGTALSYSESLFRRN